jgi:hypothetical protein
MGGHAEIVTDREGLLVLLVKKVRQAMSFD